MKSLNSWRYAVSIGVAAAMLASCGGGNSSSVSPVSADAAAFAHRRTFTYTGSPQTFTVPEGVTQIKVDVLGANGGSVDYDGAPGGYGGRVVATLSVTPQEQLTVYVGGNGSGSTGGFNGGAAGGIGDVSGEDIDGAGGGGASDVRTGPRLADRIVVAGGGGGGGGLHVESDGANFGGKGGGLVGASGGGNRKCRERGRSGERLDNCGGAGGGGTQTAAGSGGMSGTHSCYYGHQPKLCGADGTEGAGGAGGNSGGYSSDSAGGGGGGGGGYYGGGGGGGGAYLPGFSGPGGGAGGGSSYVEAGARGVKEWKGWKATQRVVVFYW